MYKVILAALYLTGAALIVPSPAYGALGCTNENPLPSNVNNICIGYGRECNVFARACSSICGTPGTFNPCGYSPKVG
jgi:hypothetical protein